MIPRAPRERLWIALGLLAITAALFARFLPGSSAFPSSPVPVSSLERRLTPGISIEHSLSTGKIDVYRISLHAGDFVHAIALQEGVDVALTLSSPEDRKILTVDSPNGAQFAESLFAVIGESGLYRLKVKAERNSLGSRGRYRLRLEKPRPASRRDRLRGQAAEAFAQGEVLRRRGTEEDRRTALQEYEKALQLWRVDQNREQQGTTLYRLGWVHQSLEEYEAARSCFEQALTFLDGRGDAPIVLNRLGLVSVSLGDFKTAQALYQRAQSTGDFSTKAGALNNLGALYRQQGESQRAKESIERALALYRQLGYRSSVASTLINLSGLYLDLGELLNALQAGKEALEIQQSRGDGSGEAESLARLGMAFNRIGWRSTALGFLGQAVEKARRSGDIKDQVLALTEMGGLFLDEGDVPRASLAITEASRQAAKSSDLAGRANATAMLGRLYVAQGEPEKALEPFSRAEAIYRGWNDLNDRASTLYGKAMALRDLGRLEEAHEASEQSLRLIEDLISRPMGRGLRASLLASRHDYYSLSVETLMLLHRRNPAAGYDVQAFSVSERMRARTSLEELAEARVSQEIPPDLLARRDALERQLVQKEKERSDLSQQSPEARLRALSLDREIHELLDRSEAARAEIWMQSPRSAAFRDPRPAQLSEIQALLDDNTTLLAYTVGRDVSFLFRVELRSLEVYELPAQAELERLVRQAYKLVSQPHPSWPVRQQATRALGQLGEKLLAPLAGKLGGKSLVIVGDDILRFVPFAALPDPDAEQGSESEPLVVRHSLIHLPSASLAVLLRREALERRPRPASIAMLADPVFRSDDSRNEGRGKRAPDPLQLDRLFNAHLEAEKILSLFPTGRKLKALGFDATTDLAKSPELSNYRYLHIATHSQVIPFSPERSGIVLSRFDRQGKPREWLLPSYQIYNLDLPFDLVVLSACRTGVDARMRGESVSGLSRAFMYAGATRVIVSLWDVDDRATADMMPQLYEALLHGGKTPAEALREAQIRMFRSKAWSAPYYWAGFILQGEWR
jgi:CHAT domain-containing protein